MIDLPTPIEYEIQEPSMPDTTRPTASSTSVPGPVPGTRLTEDYVRRIGGLAYLWGWPMVNIRNRKTTFDKLPGPGMMGGIVPVAPANQIGMLRDYIVPEERVVACPNQDVVYGFSLRRPGAGTNRHSGAGLWRQVLGLSDRRSAHGFFCRDWARCMARSRAFTC